MPSRAPRTTRRERRKFQHAATRAIIASLLRPGVAVVTTHGRGLVVAIDGRVLDVPGARVSEWLQRVAAVEGVRVTSAWGMTGCELPSSLRAVGAEVLS